MNDHKAQDEPCWGWRDYLSMSACYAVMGLLAWAIYVRTGWPAIAAAVLVGVVFVFVARDGEP